MSQRGFKDSLRQFVTQWLADRPTHLSAGRVGFQFLYTIAGLADDAIEAIWEGTYAAQPGSDSRVDNLSLLGQSRARIQGETETNAEFIVTLQHWLTDLRGQADDAGLAKELNRWFAGNPMVRVINRKGLYTTCTMSGGVQTVSQVTAAWDWDSQSNPERGTGTPNGVGWFDYWIVVYPLSSSVSPWTSYVATTGHWGDGQAGPGSVCGIGLTVTPAEVDVIRTLITKWKGAHITTRCLIWSYDNAAFDPATPTRAGNPDGSWGRWFNTVTLLASRNRLHRYTSLGPERPSQ